ncbi:MAG: glycosidase [Planctomycetota bacterium]
MKLTKYEGNPIISPHPDHAWESLATCNPGAYYDEAEGVVRLLYRAAGDEPEHVIRFGLATSTDGYRFERLDEPVFGPSPDGFDAGCVEDPRVVRFGDHYFVTYACRHYAPGRYWEPGGYYVPPDPPADFPLALRTNHTLTGLAITKDFQAWIRAGRMTDPTLDDRDVILFPEKVGGRFVRLHRPMTWVGPDHGTDHPAIWIGSSDDLLAWPESRLLARARSDWERKIGGNGPPVRTDRGWLVIYHGVGDDRYYRLGAMLLDLDEPWRVLGRAPDWIMEPEHEYETRGCYEGGGVVFPCGNVVINGTLFVYYGAADKYCGVATCDLAELVEHLLACPP